MLSHPLHAASWWPEFLAARNADGWSRLAKRYGVSATALRNALSAAGETKAPAPSGRKPTKATPKKATAAPAPKPAPVAAAPASLLDAFRDRLGKESDGAIAKAAGVSRQDVAAFRKKHSIPAYRGYLFEQGRGPVPTKPLAQPGAPVIEPTGPPVVETAPAAPAAAPRPDAHQPVWTHAFMVVASNSERELEFVMLGSDIAEVTERAVRGLRSRSRGPWTVRAVQRVREGLR